MRSSATGGASPRDRGSARGSVDPGAPAIPDPPGNSPPPPEMVSRSAWGGDRYCKPRATPVYGEVSALVVHHTVSTNSYSQAQAPGVVLGICRFHRNSNGWNDVGYNMLVDRFGTIYEGRSGGVERAVIGAHAEGYNGQTSGIALIGTFTRLSPPAAATEALQRVIDWKLAVSGITRNERVPLISTGGRQNRFKNGRTIFVRPVSGHRDLGSTTCPGDGVYAGVGGFASKLAASSRGAVRISERMRRVRTADGRLAIRVSGRIRAGRKAVSGATIAIQGLTDQGWVKVAETRSRSTGVWAATLSLRSRMWIRGAYAGSNDLRAGRSRWYYTPSTSTRRRR